MIYLIQDKDKTILNLAKGHHHCLWKDGAVVDKEIWFHGTEEYNIAVDVTGDVSKVVVDGSYRRLTTHWKNSKQLDGEVMQLKTKELKNGPYYFLNGHEERGTISKTKMPSGRFAKGKILLEGGEYKLTATPYDSKGKPGTTVSLTVDIRANPSRVPTYDEGLELDIVEWKDIQKWQKDLRNSNPSHPDCVSKRAEYDLWRLSAVTYYKQFVYIVHEKWGVVFRVDKNDNNGPTSGISTFLDVKKGIEIGGQWQLGNKALWHSGLRSIALHPDGGNWNGRCYVAVAEVKNSAARIQKEGLDRLHYIERTNQFTPVEEEGTVIEFLYKKGKGDITTYRHLFRVSMPVIDHTIRQLMFGPDKYLYILHGDGSVESKIVGDGQKLDGLGKIFRIDPLDGTKNLKASNKLKWGQYSTKGNPFDYKPGEKRPNPAIKEIIGKNGPKWGPVPKETWAFGFRNPHTMTFTKGGQLIVGEAGRDTFEGVNVIVKGGNYGWSAFEGTHRHTKIGSFGGGQKGLFYTSLPPKDKWDECPKCKFRWPATELGHDGYEGMQFNQQAMAGGHVVENSSPVHKHGKGQGKYFLCQFPRSGEFYYSYVPDLLQARDTALLDLKDHKIAPLYAAKFRANGQIFNTFLDFAKSYDPTYKTIHNKRIDVRIGRDSDGTMYILSKTNGKVFKIKNSVP